LAHIHSDLKKRYLLVVSWWSVDKVS